MKHFFSVLFALLLFSLYSFSQTDYYRGYHNGFRFGCQCYDRPQKNVSVYSGSYDKGYNDGKLDGVIHAQRKMNNSNSQNSGYKYNSSDLYVPDFEMIYQVLNSKQSTHLSNQQRIDELDKQSSDVITSMMSIGRCVELSNRSGKVMLIMKAKGRALANAKYWSLDYSSNSNFVFVKNIFENYISDMKKVIQEIYAERRNTVKQINDTRSFYENVSSYPQNVPNGWHNVRVTNNVDYLSNQKVYVDGGKIVKLCVNDYYLSKIEHTQPIFNCRGFIKVSESDEYLEVFFLDLISEKGPINFVPLGTSRVAFWTDIYLDEFDDVVIVVDGVWAGTIKKSIFGAAPKCAQEGTIVFENKPGTYKYQAMSDKYDWSGTITITGDQCQTLKLSGK
mgnify:CR=1 FL=1